MCAGAWKLHASRNDLVSKRTLVEHLRVPRSSYRSGATFVVRPGPRHRPTTLAGIASAAFVAESEAAGRPGKSALYQRCA